MLLYTTQNQAILLLQSTLTLFSAQKTCMFVMKPDIGDYFTSFKINFKLSSTVRTKNNDSGNDTFSF